jgi:glycogen(starch) synthase
MINLRDGLLPHTPQRVLMTADTVGGVFTYALDLAAALSEHGVEVALATMGQTLSPAQQASAGRIRTLRVFESTYKLEWMDDPWDGVQRAGAWLLELERALEPDMVHLNGYAHGQLPWRAPVVMVAHSCVLSWWQAVKGEAAPAAWERYRQEVTRGLQAADLVVAPTQAMLDAVMHHYGTPRRTRVIPNGRDLLQFQPGTKEPFVFSAGRLWDEAKGVMTLAAVAPELSWPVCVAGDNTHPDGGEAQPEGVQLLGVLSQEEVAAWLARASIYALPARYEPFGLSALEAALAGCALVLGDIPSLREVWGDAARFVPPGDPSAWRQAISGLIDDEDERQRLATQARARACRYTPGRMADAYLQAYGDLMHRNLNGADMERTTP